MNMRCVITVILILTSFLSVSAYEYSALSEEREEEAEDSVVEFFKQFYAEYDYYFKSYFQEVAVESNHYGYSLGRKYWRDRLLGVISKYCCDDIVYKNRLTNTFPYINPRAIRVDMLLGMQVKKIPGEWNCYAVNFPRYPVVTKYTLIKQGNRMKVYWADFGDSHKHPVSFRVDTVRVVGMPAKYNHYFRLYGFTVSSYYEVVDTLSVGRDIRAAILSPAVMGFTEQLNSDSLYSDRLLLIEHGNRRWVYDNVICNEANYAPNFNCEELSTKPEFVNDIEVNEDSNYFFLNYEYGQGAKAGWNIKIKFPDGEPVVSGMMWYDHSSDMRRQRTIIDMDMNFPLRKYRRLMPLILEDDNWNAILSNQS